MNYKTLFMIVVIAAAVGVGYAFGLSKVGLPVCKTNSVNPAMNWRSSMQEGYQNQFPFNQ